jgi:hypothetical protein
VAGDGAALGAGIGIGDAVTRDFKISAAVLAAAIAASTVSAAPARSASLAQSATPLAQLVQADYYTDLYYRYGYRPPCPYRYHWECWFDVYGRQGCGCRPDFGLHYYIY